MKLKEFILLYLLLHFQTVKPNVSEFGLASRQKMILSLSRNLFIKNFIVFKQSSFVIISEIISFAKLLSQSNIYISFLSAKEIKLTMNDLIGSRIVFSKTIISTFNEDFNNAIYELISEDELGASKFFWLVWNNKYRLMEGNGFYYIPYNAQLLIAEDDYGGNENISCISEIYHPRINSSIMFMGRFGVWSENNGFEIFERDLYKRRFDMNGTEINILVYSKMILYQPWIDFINIILENMNFWPNQILIKNLDVSNEQWEILFVPQIYDEKTEKPSEVLGLTWKTSTHIYIRYDEMLEDNGISRFVRPFSAELWEAILVSIALVGICSCILCYVKKRIGNPCTIGYISAIYNPIEAFLNQCGSETTGSLPTRITIMTTRTIALFIVPAYSGFILSLTLYTNVKLPFTDIKGLVQDGTYKLAFPIQEQWDDWFQERNDPWMKMAYENYSLPLNEMPANAWESTTKICKEAKVAFLIHQDYIPAALCKVVKIPTPIMTGWYGYSLRPKSPYSTIFNRIFKMYISTGMIEKYEQEVKWRAFRPKSFKHADEKNYVELKNVEPILQIITFFQVTAAIILLVECLCKRLQNFINNGQSGCLLKILRRNKNLL